MTPPENLTAIKTTMELSGYKIVCFEAKDGSNDWNALEPILRDGQIVAVSALRLEDLVAEADPVAVMAAAVEETKQAVFAPNAKC